MNTNPISSDDPRLTAYAFNEMTAEERVEFEQLLAADPATRRAVEDIRATGAMVATALEAEPMPAPGVAIGRAAIIPGGDLRKLDGGGGVLKGLLKQPIRFPQFYYIVSGMAAACFAVFFVYWQREQAGLETRKYVEVDIATFQAATAAADAEREEKAKRPVDPAQAAVSAPAAATAGEIPVIAIGDAAVLPDFRNPAEPLSVTGELGLADTVTTVSPGALNFKGDKEWGGRVPAAAPIVAGNAAGSIGQEQPVTLTPFMIAAAPKQERATDSLGGSRIKASLMDLGSASGMASKQFAHFRGVQSAGLREPEFNTESYGYRKDNDYLRVSDHPLSTFSIDVDTASYANVRRFLKQGQRPPVDAVRIEELVNYFTYNYAQPIGNVPFAASLEVASAPWAPEHRLVRIGLKGREVSDTARPAANLVFLLDVSGSMQSPNKLPLVKQSLRLLVDKLRPDDRVAIAVYAGASGLALPSTPVVKKADILDAIDRLEASGSTNGSMGIHLAYDIAKANFVPGGVNRVILATDGDFNVGTTNEGDLVRLVGEKAKSGVFLSVLGFGMGNLKDGTLEQLADKGNGNYAYIDSIAEARKALVEQAGGTLVTIAKDVKIQVEFNPTQVAAYRLIGYENRLLAKEDFNDDAVDAGEIGAGHTVTALYEVVPAGNKMPVELPSVDALKYQQPKQGAGAREQGAHSGELLTVKIRYKEPAGEISSKLEFALRDTGADFEQASDDFKFAAAVAGFGLTLRDSPHKGSLTLADVSKWARAGVGSDAGGYRTEFLGLVQQAQMLQ